MWIQNKKQKPVNRKKSKLIDTDWWWPKARGGWWAKWVKVAKGTNFQLKKAYLHRIVEMHKICLSQSNQFDT